MVSVERLRPEEFISPYHSSLARTFPYSFLHFDNRALFDDDDIMMKKDLVLGSTLFDSMMPSLFDIRRGRHRNYEVLSPFSEFGRKDLQESSDGKVIPIKFESSAERYQQSSPSNVRRINKSTPNTKDKLNDFISLFHDDYPELVGTPSNSPATSKSNFNRDHASDFNSNFGDNCSSYDSRQTLNKYVENNINEKKEVLWKSIPVQHLESSNSLKFVDSLSENSNNKSSIRNYTQTHTNNVSKEALSTNNGTISNPFCDKALSGHLLVDRLIPESVDNVINSPPSYPIYDVLRAKLSKDGRTVDYIRGDGNCFFRALSKELYGSEQYHKAVRSYIVDIIATNKEKFAPFVDKENVQEHVTRMSEDHCWATTCEIYAAATLLQRDLFMLTPDHRNENYSWLLFKPVFDTEPCKDLSSHSCYITLCNTNGNHYDRVVPNHGGCNCFLPFPQLGEVV